MNRDIKETHFKGHPATMKYVFLLRWFGYAPLFWMECSFYRFKNPFLKYLMVSRPIRNKRYSFMHFDKVLLAR